MRTELFMYFCIKKYIGNKSDVCQQLKIFLPPPPPPTTTSVVYATALSKAVVPVLFLFCVALWFILRGASCFKVFPCSLSSCFIIPFSIVITSLGEEGGACLRASRVFVRLSFRYQFLSFFSSSWSRGLPAVCYCGTPWTFLLTVLNNDSNLYFCSIAMKIF